MKGKKFDAAEKHFLGELAKKSKIIKLQDATILTLHKKAEYFEKQYLEASSENAQLKEWVERLLKYTELEQKDIKRACEKDKELAQILSLIGCFGSLFPDQAQVNPDNITDIVTKSFMKL